MVTTGRRSVSVPPAPPGLSGYRPMSGRGELSEGLVVPATSGGSVLGVRDYLTHLGNPSVAEQFATAGSTALRSRGRRGVPPR